MLDLARTRIEAKEIERYRRSLEGYTRELASSDFQKNVASHGRPSG